MPEIFWYCRACGDGPYGSWQRSCQNCQQFRDLPSYEAVSVGTEEQGPESLLLPLPEPGRLDAQRQPFNIPFPSPETSSSQFGHVGAEPETPTPEELPEWLGKDSGSRPGTHSPQEIMDWVAERENLNRIPSYTYDDVVGETHSLETHNSPRAEINAHEEGDGDVYSDNACQEQDGTENVVSRSSSPDSIFSAISYSTMATEFTQTSGFSIAQIKDATQILMSILQDDKVLAPLYESARRNPDIGVKKLRRQVRQSIKKYAEDLRNEATDYLSFSASRLVRAKANYAARCVASQEIQERHPLIKLDQGRNEVEESSDDDMQEQPGQEREVGDLVDFRSFLTESAAYATFRAELEAFCLAQADPSVYSASSTLSSRQPVRDEKDQEPHGRIPRASNSATTKEARAPLLSRLDRLCLAIGCLEPPLDEGWARIRCQCRCGDRFFDDVYEQAEGGVATLVEKMRNSSANISITAVPYSSDSPNQQYILRSPTWFWTLQCKLFAVLPGYGPRSNTLPYHNAGNPGAVTSGTNPSNQQQQQSTLHLMSCVHHSRDHTVLLQDDISPINNDSALFSFLKARIPRRRKRLLQILSCRSIEGIYFCKFRLRLGNSVEVRHHNPCCQPTNSSICECVPPDYKLVPTESAEYTCKKTTPADTWPLVGPKYLAHMLKCPLKINDKQTWIFNLVPKRNWGPLSGRADEPTEGWGFYFEEGWDFDFVVYIAITIFVLASLLFGVLWTVLKYDIQGAFGVSSYIVTFSGLVIAVVVRQAGKMD